MYQHDASVIMPVCAWPDPANTDGDVHPELLRALDSVEAAIRPYYGAPSPSVELLVGVDGYAHRVMEAVRSWAAHHPSVTTVMQAFERSERVTYGNRQRNRFLDQGPTGRLVMWQDQDDRFFPFALTRVMTVANQFPGDALMFKMKKYGSGNEPVVLWETEGRLQRGHVGGHMLATPNEPELLGRWEPETEYTADYEFIAQTVDKCLAAGRQVVWRDEFISMLRPWCA